MEAGLHLEEAVSLLCENLSPVSDTMELPLEESCGRILAEDLYALTDQPPFDRSPLDGYALRAEDIADASRENPVRLRMIGEVCAGDCFAGEVRPGEAVRIMTGAMVPRGCDCVVMQELTDYGEVEVLVFRAVGSGKNLCFAGEDIQYGQLLAKAGEKLTFAHLGALAAAGVARARVYRPLRDVVLNIGDELCAPGAPLPPGKIYNANTFLLTARLRELGVQLLGSETVEDSPQTIASRLLEKSALADLVITTGGVSVGKKDYVHQALAFCGARTLFSRVKLKPGSPVTGAVLRGKPVLCLSGNPFAAAATFELFARPAMEALSGDEAFALRRVSAAMGCAFPKASPTRRFIRATLRDGRVSLNEGHSSGMLGSMIGCNAMVDIPAGSLGLSEGDPVGVILL